MAQEILADAKEALADALGDQANPLVEAKSAVVVLGRNVMQALDRLSEITAIPISEAMIDEAPKKARLIGDMSLGVVKLGLRAREGDAQVQRDRALAELLERLRERKN